MARPCSAPASIRGAHVAPGEPPWDLSVARAGRARFAGLGAVRQPEARLWHATARPPHPSEPATTSPPRRARGVHRRQGARRGRRAARLRPWRHGRGRREPCLRRRSFPAPRLAARGCNPVPPASSPVPPACSPAPAACSPVPAGPILEANGRSAPTRANIRFLKWLKGNAATVSDRHSNLAPTTPLLGPINLLRHG